jgi:hypothetical protein
MYAVFIHGAGMTNNECPAGCRSSKGEAEAESLRRVSPSELRLTPLILTASGMQEEDQLLLCNTCGRVLRRSFDSYILRFHLRSLGTFHAHQSQFEPGPWLLSEMERLTVLSPPNAARR